MEEVGQTKMLLQGLDMTVLKTAEEQADAIADELMRRLGTSEVSFCFRTANGSVYAADSHARTVRYKAAENSFQPPSNITVFLDHKYMDPVQTDRSSEQYLPNSLVHENGFLALFAPDKITQIKTWDDIPESATYETVRDNIFFVVFDQIQNKLVKKAPVSFAPKIGTHPIEFCDPDTHRLKHRNHFGNLVTDATVTTMLSGEERKKALKSLALLSLASK